MKKLILTILLLTFTINAQSAYVPLQTAQKAALNWFNQNQENKSRTRSKSAASAIKDVYIQQKNETNTLFIFNMNPTGFVVVAADDTVDPILAYSFDSELVQDNINPAAKEWIDNYSEQISNVIATQPKNGEKIGAWSTLTSESFNIETAALDVPAMPPLLSTKWDVFADYNLFSPGIGSVKTDTGEMALTMAQVLRYWKYPESGIGEYSYTPRCIPELGEQSANFHDTIYDYSKMPDQLTAESTPEEISAVAELIYHCGVSVETNYLMVGSSAAIWDGFDALIKYFDYSMTSMKLLYKTGYSDEEWKNILYNELDNHRVIIYQSCRKFICDGYQGTEFFHFSFCWGGDGNGYYRLDTIDPNEDHAFTGIHTIIAGIQPNNTYETQTILAENFDNTFPPNGWSITIVNDTSPSPQWSQVNSGTNPTCTPYSGTNMVAFNSNTCPSGAEARLVLPDIDLTAKDYAKLIFYMYQDTGETDKTNEGVTFQLSEDGTNWQDLKFIPRYTLSSGWHEYRIDLTYYKGKTIKIGILGHSEGGNNIYLDHLTIQYVVPGSFFTSDRLVSYTGAPVSFEDTSFRPTSWLWDFGDGETSTQQHPTHSYASSGQYTVTLSINNGSSVNRKKDYILILPTFTPPYTPANGGDFESNALHFMSQNLEGGFNLWESGQPSNVISDTTSGTTVWKTDLDTNIVSDRDYVCALYSPLFDLDIIGTYYLKFNQRMDAFGASYDIRTGAAWIEYSLDRGQTWQKLGDTSGNPAGTQNWYNIDGNEVLESSCWWQKTSTYIQSIYNITEFSGQSDIAFRFVYKIQNSPYAFYDIDGWAIDDFEIIYEPPTAIFTADKLVSYAGSPIAFTEQSTFAMTWLWDFGDGTTSTSQHITHTYQTPGQYTVTLNINNGGSVATHVYTILPAIKPSYTLEDGGNFETHLTDFFSYATSGDINVWELGQPSHTINNTASGRNVWKTDLDANFPKGDYTNALCTPIFSFSDPGKYYLKFQFRMDTYYSNAPGAGWLEYSTDEGLTWQKLGSKTENPEGTQNWYNTTQSSVIDYGEACWWIRVFTSDYIQAIYNLTEFSGQSTIAFRFMFKVKGTLNDALYNVDGWAIDDFQIAFTPEKAEIGSTTQISSVGQPIQFKDQSVFVTDSTSWSWEFPGGIPSCSTAQNPTVVYQSPGSYAVYLTSCDASGYCLTETKQSYMTIYESITTACETTAVDSGNYIGVKNFDFNTIHNSTGSADTDGGNLDFTSSIVTTLSANTSYSVSVYGDNNVRYVKIFIDYNNDGDFEDTDEVVYNASGSETFIGTITTPANPIFDEILTMRVIARYNTITDPCTINLNYGQAEDYGVVFVSGHNKIRLTQAATSLYSDGLIIEDINFIKDTGDLIAIANNVSQTTWTTRDVGTGLKRWDRIWQIDFDDINSNGGAVKFIFDFSDGGFEELSYNNATTWYLYKRQGESGEFIKDIPASAVSGDQVIFDAIHVNDLSDHFYYTLEAEAILEISDITEQATGIGSPKNMTFTVRDTNSTALSISAQTSDLTVSVNNICFSVISGGSMISDGNAYTLNKTEELAVISAIITPTGSLVGVVDLTITVSDGTYRVYDLFKLDIVDHPPEISNMLDHVTGVDKAISIPFTISDTDSHVFRLTAQSSNQIVTEDNISFGILSGGTIISSGNIYTVMQNASLANVFLEITPTQGAMGETSLTLTISDMSNHIVHSFKLLVFDFPPEISDIKNAFTDFETAISIPFKISDTDSDILMLTAITSNHIATPENISFGILSLGSINSNGNQYTIIKNDICADVFVEITPSQGAMGDICLTITVADITNAPDDSDSFNLKVINYPPKISNIPDIITSFETSSSSYFSVSDTDTDTLTIEATSSGPSVRVDNISFVPLANCIIIKDGSTYTISKTQDLADIAVYITPTAGQSGPVLITVTVSDGMNLTQSMSVFSVYIAQEGESLQIGEPFITSVDDQFGPNSPLTLYGAWPQIIGIANADGSIDIAWYDDTTKKTYLTQVDRNYVIRRNIDVTLLDQFAGFTKDNSGNYYLLSAVEENIRYSATPSNENRSNIVKLMKLDKFGNKIYEADLKDAGDPIYQPLSGGASRIEYGNGVIYVLFSRLTEFATDINTRHQKASYRIIDAETGSVSTTMPVGFSHSFDQRLYFDGDYILSLELGDVYSRAVGLAKHDTSDRLGSMQDIFTIKGGMNSYPATGGGYNNTFTRLGNVRKGNTSYLVAMITETDGIHFGLHILLDARNVAIINVVHNFENNFAYAANPDAETFVSYYNTGYDNPYGSKLRWITHYLDENTENAERIKLEKVGPDRFVVLWEKWTSDTYVETYGTVIDELGNVLVPEKALNKARLNRGDDIFLLDNKAAWIEGLADSFLLHIVDDTDLSLTTRQIVFTDDPPVTAFTSSSRIGFMGTAIRFFDQSEISPSHWQWSFPGGDPVLSNSQNPTVTYNLPGTYPVALTASNTVGTGSKHIQLDYITIYPAPAYVCFASVLVNSSNRMGIKTIDFNTIHNSTGDAYEDGGYVDFTTSHITALSLNTTYTFAVTSTNINYVKIFINYNNDNDFDDTNELIYEGDVNEGIVTGSMTTPVDPVTDVILTMRVIGAYHSIDTACPINLNYGQVEDYGIVFQSPENKVNLSYDFRHIHSGGLIIKDKTFLKETEDYISAWHNGVLPAWTTSNMPAGFKGWEKVWQLNVNDINTNGGNVELIFDFQEAGFDENVTGTTSNYFLLSRQGVNDDFKVILPASSLGSVVFDTVNVDMLQSGTYFTLGYSDNTAPHITSVQRATITINTSEPIPFTVSDAQGGDITITAVSNNENVTIININGSITGSYTFTASPGLDHALTMLVKCCAQFENAQVTMTAVDSTGLTTSCLINIILETTGNDTPIISDIFDQSRPEGHPYSMIHLDDFVFDPDNTVDELIWTAENAENFTITIDTNRNAMITPKDPDWNGSEIITFIVKDPGNLTASDIAAFTVTAINDVPVVSDISDQTISEDTSFAPIHLDNFVSDIEDAYSQINWTATGQTDLTITITDRVVMIEAADNWYGSETITFIAEDTEGLTSSDTAIFTVTSVNDAPVISDIGDQTIDEDCSFTSITLDEFISDIEDLDSQITWTVTGNSELAVTITGGIASIKAPANWSGAETITFMAEDTGGLTVSDSAIFTVNAVNDAPVISGIIDQTVNEDTSFTAINLDDCVVDIEDADSQISWAVSGNSDLTVTITNRVAVIESPANWNGSETVIFKATDTEGLTATHAATFTVIAVNDPPVFSEIPDQSQAEGNSFTVIHLDDYVFDIDNNDDSITWMAENQNHLTITINSNREAIIEAKDNDWNGSETIKFVATAPDNITSVDYVVFTVTAVNDAPVISDIIDQTALEDTSFTPINLDNYVVDVDNTDDEISWMAAGQSDLTVTITNRIATIEAPENWYGTETITFTAQDTAGLTACDAVIFTMTSVNDAPVVSDISDQTILEDSSFATILLDNFVSDIEDAYSQITWTATGQTDLTITITDRVATIEAENNWYGIETITFIAQDSEGLTSSDTAIFTVTSVNDAPVISDVGDQTIDEDFSFTSISLDQYISDIEDSDSQITWTVTGNSELAITMTNRIATIKAPANWSGTETITFIAEDTGGLTVSDSAIFTVNAVNDAPVISGIIDQTVNEDTSFTAINLDDCVVDIEDADSQISWAVSGNSDLTVTITNRVAVIESPANWNGSETVIFKATDTEGLTATHAATFTVIAVNDPPVFSEIPDQSQAEGNSFTVIHLDDYVFDIDNNDDSITWMAENQNHLTITINSNREAIIEAKDNDWNGSETIKFVATAPDNITSVDYVVFTVTAVNDAPVISDIIDQTALEDTSFTPINLDNYVVDVDNTDDEISWMAAGQSDLTVTITNRIATIEAPENWYGTETITFTAQDTAGLTACDAVIFTMTSVNDAPVVSDISDQTILEDSSFATILLDNFVSDIEDAYSQITWTATGQTDLTITITDRVATIEAENNWYGIETITFIAQDSEGLTSSDTAIFTVTSVNDAPVISDIGDQTVDEDCLFTSIMLDEFISDIEDLDSQITWTVTGNSELAVTITDRIVTIKASANWSGTETITFMAKDTGGLTASDAAIFTVNSVNDAPAILYLTDKRILENDSFPTIHLDDYVVDVDHTDDEISWTVSGQSDLTVTITNRIATIEAPENWKGTETITFTAQDTGGLTTSQAVTFSIIGAPDIADIPDQTVPEDTPFAPINLDDFVDDNNYSDSEINWSVTGQSALSISITNRVATIEAPENWNGTESLIFIAEVANVWVGGDSNGLVSWTSASFTMTAVNDPPSFTMGQNISVPEDSSTMFFNYWATNISPGASNEKDACHFELAIDHTDLFSVIPTLNSNGTLKFTPKANVSGVATVDVILKDNGGTENAGIDTSAAQSFKITITEINDPPSFTIGPNQRVNNNKGIVQHVANWATNISAGPPNEDQTQLHFQTIVENDSLLEGSQNGIFISNSGDLTYTPTANANGTITVTVILEDGGTGTYTSGEQRFTITLKTTNQAPSFVKGSNVTIDEDEALSITIQSWATNISPGAANEMNQQLEFYLSPDNSGLFAIPPKIIIENGEVGHLFFAPAKNAFGSTTVSVYLKDNAGTALGGVDTSATQEFNITINPVNDPPTFLKGVNIMIIQDYNLSLNNWARSISAGPANETGQSLTFHTSTVPETLFVNQPQVSSTGTLTFRTSNQAGIATVSVYLMDNGTGNNTSATETFAITIKPTSAPELSEIEDYEIMQDTQTENISIVVTDEDTPLNNITVTATSSNTDLVNTNNLAVSKMASLWRLSITPITGQSGVTTITVTADDGSQTTSETFNLTVHGIPSAQVGVASDNYSETAGTVPMFVHFSPANIQNENDITGWLWDFGDGKTSTEKSPVHTFYLDDDLNDPSLYTVRLTVYGFNGSSSTDTKSNYITLYSFKYANFFAMNTIGPEDLRVNFYSQCIGFGSSATFQWNFGDGSMSTLENPIHTYTETGIYTVSLAASNGSFTRTMSKPDFVKVTGRSISGQITASDTTLGIENCLVEIWSVANNVLLGYTHTASDGSYSIKELPSLEHIIIGAWPPLSLRNQYYKTYYDGADNRSDATKVSTLTSNLTGQNMTLEKIPQMGIRGRILDTDGITGIANIEVDVFSNHFQTGRSATTDAEGFYTVTGLQNASDYIVSTWSEHLNMEFFYAKTGSVLISKNATKIELANEYVDDITITVLPTGRISGHVSANGQALANIKISAWSDMLGIGNKALTNEMGDYTISGLISQSNAANITYIVECRSPDYPYQAYNTVSERHLASPVTTGRTDIDFTIKTGNDIKGTVTDAHNNVLSGVSISAWSESKKVKGEAISQSSGEYTLSNMPPASDYKIIATTVDYPVQYYNQQKLSEHAEYVDNTNGDVDHIDFILDKGGIIKGYVKLENDFTAAGAGIWVNIWSKSTSTGGDVVTDINGMYEISGLEKAVSDYKISIYHDSCMPSFYNASETVYEFQDAESVAPSPTEYRNIVLKSGFTVTGKIINAEGTAASGIKIEAFSEETNGWGEAASTDILVNDANYIIKGLIPGTYNITISPDNYISETKSIVVDDDISNVDFILIAPDRKISGTITGLDLNKEISLTASSEQLNDSRVISIKGTGNNVDYEITGLKPAADYRVDLRSSDYPYQVYNGKTDWDQANEIDLTNSDSSGINFTLESADLSISGILSFPTQTYEHVWVEASSKALNFTKGVHLNYTGSNPVSYQIEGLMKGAYIVSIWPALSKSQYYNDSDTEKNAQAVDLNAGSQTNINFTLKTGAFIEGHVYEADGTPASSVKVQANSKNSDSWGLAQTNGNGFYRIEGLDTVNDFIVQAQKTGLAAIYFNSEDAVMDQSAAEMVRANSSNINMRFVVVESISGIVRNINGQRIESSVRVIAKSEVNQIETSVYTTYIGTYKIDGLIPGNDYKVTAVPHASSPYMSQTKTNISTNSTDINFMLEKGHSIEGSVSSQNTVIRNVKIEVLSVEADFYAFAKTDINGHYEISGLKSATDYAITATPPEESAYRVSITDNIEINTDYIFNIVLNSAYTISGHIYEADGTTPVPAVRVTVFSSDQNFMSGATTDETGYYRVENIPDASDFIVTASPTNFAQQKRIDQASGNTVDFILSSGGTISGAVNTAYGPFENATVEVFSETVNISKSDTTDINGNYQITGLHNYWNGILVSDYVVTVYASGYPNESKGQKSVGDIVNFTLTKGEENELSGIIKDSTGVLLPSDSETVWIKVYLDGVYQTKTKVKKDGTGAFTVKGLQPNTNYTLQVSNSTKSEWIGSDGIGVSENADAAFFTTSDTVDFSFGVEKTYHPPTVMTGSLTKTGSDYKVLYLVSTTDDTPVTMRGVCWDYYSEPTTDNNCTQDGTGTGRYESVLENLPYKYIYFRAYATNAGGTAYGNQKSIQMTCESGYTLKAKNPESGGKIEIFPDKDGCYRQNVHVTIKAIPDACYRFTGWSGDCSGTDLCGLVMSDERTATPSFERLTYTVSVSAKYGSLSQQIDQVTYDCGTSISLAVTPNAGYRFDHWEGGLENQGATVNILVDQPLNVSAICVPITQNRSISGYVQDVFGRGVANASILFSETGDTVNTNASGFYSYTLTQGNSVTAIPELTGCTFSPPNRSYDNVASSINAQNYTITTVTSLQPGLRVWIDKNANAAYDNGEEVSGAEIYMNGAVNPYGTTDSQGVIGIINLRYNDHIHATKTFYAYVSPKADDAYFDNDRLQNPYYATTENWSMNGSNYVFTMDSDIRMADGAYQEFPGANQSLTSAPKDAQGNILLQLIHPFIKWNLVVAISDQLITDAWQQKIRIGLQGGNRILYNYTDGYFIIKNMVLILGGESDTPQFEMANIHITYGMPLATAYVLGYRYTKPNRVITLGSMWSAYTPEDITWWSVFAHELGHYLVGVYDEYYNGKGDSNTAWAYRQSHNGGSGEPNEFPSYYGIMDNSILAEELSDVTDYYPHDYTQKDVVSSHYSKTQGQSCWETFKSAYTEEIKTQMQANGYTGFSDDFFEGLIVPPHTTGSYPESDRSKRPGPIMVHERDELNFIEW
jgi:PKD repeat protein